MSPDIYTDQRGPSSTRNLRLPPAHRASPKKPKHLRRSPKPIKVMTKSYSEPLIFQPIGDGDSLVGGCRSFDSREGCGGGGGGGGCIPRFNTLDDVLSSSSDFLHSPLSRINARYEREAKVVITVTVEGSPGPVRTLVKLGSSVEDTIKMVVQKYGDEGRTPRLHINSASSFDLHVSYFSLQCLDRSDAIGEAGSRSFFLRKNDKKWHDQGNKADIEYDKDVNESILSPSRQLVLPSTGFPPVIARKMNKFERRFLRLLKLLLGCMESG